MKQRSPWMDGAIMPALVALAALAGLLEYGGWASARAGDNAPSALLLPGDALQRDATRSTPQGMRTGGTSAAVYSSVDEHIHYGLALASRGAVCSARSEFAKAIDLVSQALDAGDGVPRHRSALQAALQTFQEAADFTPSSAHPEARADFSLLVASHRTPVLKGSDTTNILPMNALQAYYAYATEQLVLAGDHEPLASAALYSWARVEAMPVSPDARTGNTLGAPKALALYRAALMIDPRNYLAANELGVLLARYGYMREAKEALQHSAALSQRPETWYNLSVVQGDLGEEREARQAYANYQALAAAEKPGKMSPGKAPPVRWVDPQTFDRESGPDPMGSLATNPGRTPSGAASGKLLGVENPLSVINSWLKPKSSSDAPPAAAEQKQPPERAAVRQ